MVLFTGCASSRCSLMPRSCLMIHPRTTRCVIDSTLAHDMLCLAANEILRTNSCNHLVSHSKLPTHSITISPQIQIVSSCVDCKLARVISKPQPWRRTESSDRNVLLQVVTATTYSTPFLLLCSPTQNHSFPSHTPSNSPPTNNPFLNTLSPLSPGRPLSWRYSLFRRRHRRTALGHPSVT
jgi:hypothetical protein